MCEDACQNSSGPDEWEIAFDNVGLQGPLGACGAGDCETRYNGNSFVADYDGWCVWSYTFPRLCGRPDYPELSLRVSGPTGGKYYIDVKISYRVWFQNEYADPIPCTTMINESVALNVDSDPDCDWSVATCHVTAL